MSSIKFECPGRSLPANIGMAVKLSEIKPQAIYFSICLAKAKPQCPCITPEDLAQIVGSKIGVPVVFGTHEYL